MAAVDVTSQADEGATGVRTPVRCEQAGEGWHEVGAAIVLDGVGESLDLRGGLEHLEVVTQPLDQRPGNGDRALEGVNGGLVADLVADGGQQTILGEDGLLAGVHQHEAAGAVGVLRHALLEAGLAEGGSLLVTEDAGDRGVDQQAVLAAVAIDLGGGLDLGEHRLRDTHDLAHRVVPLEGLDIHEHGAGSVGRIGDVHAAVGASGQVPQHPGVHVAEVQVASLSLLTSTLDVVEDPLDLRAGEVRGETQAADVLEAVSTLVASQFVTDLLGTGILPHNGVIDRVAGVLVPHHGGLALVGDSNGSQLVAVDVGLGQRESDDIANSFPDLDRVVLNPSGTREDLLEFLLADGHDLARVVEDDGPGRGGALVDGEHELLVAHDCCLSCLR